MNPQKLLIATLAFALLATPAIAGNYTGGGTFVVKTQFGTILDNGGVVCQGTNGDGVGGGCLSFPAPSPTGKGAFVGVNDASAGSAVAFQVCIDNNGDGICGGPRIDTGTGSDCNDQIFFSHADGGRFFNALGPLPTSFARGCEGGFAGYVVLLCQGEHQDRELGAHTHAVTRGTIALANDGSGYGDFCGGGGSGGASGANPAVAKAYRVV